MPITNRHETSNDDRARIVAAYLEGTPAKTIASVLSLKVSAVYSVIKTYTTENRVEKRKRGGQQTKKLSPSNCEAIRLWIDTDCSLSLKALKQRCHDELGIGVCEKTIDRCLRAFHYSLKRVHLMPVRRNAIETIDIRATYASAFMRILATTDDQKIYFIDEVGFSVSMRCRRGRALQGARAVQTVSNLRARNISVFASMSKRGMIFFSAQTRAFNTGTFAERLQNMFAILSGQNIQNAILVMDNVPFHRSQMVRDVILHNGHEVLFLPPYSPFLNPIENAFSKWKEEVRRGQPRDEDHLFLLIQEAWRNISSENCGEYYRHMIGFLGRCLNREEIIDE
jgi:transposase